MNKKVYGEPGGNASGKCKKCGHVFYGADWWQCPKCHSVDVEKH